MVAELVDSECFADDIDWPKLVQDLAHACSVEVVDFEVAVLWLRPHQRVANTATHEQGATTCFVNSARQKQNIFRNVSHTEKNFSRKGAKKTQSFLAFFASFAPLREIFLIFLGRLHDDLHAAS